MAWNKWKLPRFFDRKAQPRKISHVPRHRTLFEALEPRILLSADLMPGAADALADGLDRFDDRLDLFLDGEVLFGERVPMLLTVGTDSNGDPVYEAPTISDLFSIPVDANGDGDIDLHPNDIFDPDDGDDDEFVLDSWDTDGSDVVETGEFLTALVFNPASQWLRAHPDAPRADFVSYLKGLDGELNSHLDQLSEIYTVDFEIFESDTVDLTQDPYLDPHAYDALNAFSVRFALTITQTLPIDLGLEADALKLLAFKGDAYDPELPTVPVTSTLSFGFDFGVLTGGQAEEDINASDFFIRSAGPLDLSVAASADTLGFHFNVGFLGADVVNGLLDLQADIVTDLLDPNDPDVLGFIDSQHGVESTSGVVAAASSLDEVASDDAVSIYDLSHDAGFFLRIGNVGINTPVTVDDTGAVDWATLKSDIDDALVDAGLSELISVSLDGSNHVVFTLAGQTDTPLGFANESYGPAGIIQATPNGDGATLYEYLADQTFLLSVGGAIPTLVTVNFADPSHTDIGLNDGQVATVPPVVAPDAPSAYEISGEAGFTITAWKSDGTPQVSHIFTLTASETDGNTSAADLAGDIAAKIAGSPIQGLVFVDLDSGGHLRFSASATVSALSVAASGTAISEIGFLSYDINGLQLLAANSALANLSEAANFTLHLNDNGTVSTYKITVPDNSRTTLSDLAGDINAAIDAAIGENRLNAIVSGNRILLVGIDTNIRSFQVRTVNLTINDLVLDVNRALVAADLGSMVTASTDGTHLVLTAAAGKSLEISRTLTLDAGVTYAELQATTSADLFDPAKGDESHVELRLPVVVADGLKDAQTEAMWKPADVVIVGNFSPFDSDSDIATYDDQLHRFNLEFSFDPLTSVPEQDTPVAHDDVPATTDLTDEIRLVNMAELLNFNLVTAEGMVGLIQGLGTALQQIANSGLYAGYDIPFADASLADLVNYTDSDKAAFSGLIDMLLFDTGGDGIDGTEDTERLVKKVHDSDGNSYLIPWFTTAQALGTKLQELLGVTANPTYHTGNNELTYEVSLVGGSRTTVAHDDIPAQYDVDLSPFSKLTLNAAAAAADLEVALTGYTGLDMTFGINLSPPGAVILPDTTLELLNGGAGVDVKTEPALTGATGVYINYGLSRTSDFWIGIDGSPWIPVRILASDTIVNPTLSHLIDDLNDALDSALQTYDTAHGTAYYGKAEFGYAYAADGSKRLTLEATGGAGTVVLDAASTDPMMAEMGFVFDGYVRPVQTGRFEPLPLYGRLSMDASFDIDVVGTQTVTVTSTATENNKTIADLVADVDNALVAAGLGGLIKAGYDVSSTQGTRLVLSATDPLVQFTVGNANSIAQDQLGLPVDTTAADSVDFAIYGSDGHKYLITLDSLSGSSNVGQLIAEINAQIDAQVPPKDWDGDGEVEGAVVAAYNATRTGLRLTDNVRGTEPFRVETINGSKAILTLGLFGAGNQGAQNQFGDGDPYLIEGGQIGETHLDKRFFVREALMWGGLALQLPENGVPGTALFGMVGVDTDLTGSLYAEFSAEIKNPLTGVAGGTATLLQLFEGQKQGRLTEDATFEVKFDTDADWVTVTVAKDATNNTLADLVVDINKALEAASLDSKLVAEASGTRIEFVSRLVNVRGTEVNEAAFSIRASDVGATEMGLAGTLVSDNVDGIEIVAVRSASRFAVTDVNVSFGDLYELPHSGYTEGTTQPFQVGNILYGSDTTPDPDVKTTDSAIVVGIETNRLILARLNGTFADAEIVFQELGINGMNVAGALTPRTSFGEFNLHADVQDGFDDPGFVVVDGDGLPTGFGLLVGKDYDVAFDINDFGNPYDPAPPVANFDDLIGQTGDLYAFRELGYDDIGTALHGLLDVLVDVNAEFDLLTLKLPAINRSVSDLLNLLSGFERGVETMDAVFAAALAALEPDAVDLPPLALQDIPNALRSAFGMPDTAPGDFDWVTLDFDRGDAGDPEDGMLLVDMNVHEVLDTKLGLDITVSEALPNLTSAGVLKVNGTLDVNLSFGIDLKHPNAAWLFDNSSIVADVHVEGEAQTYETTSGDKDGMGLVFRASIGPLAVFIQDGDAVIDVAFTLPGLDFGLNDRKLLSTVVYADWEEPVITENYAEIVLPMFYGGEGPNDYLDDFSANGQLVNPTTLEPGTLTVTVPDFSDIEADIKNKVVEYDPFENILLGIDTLNLYLELLSDTLAGEVLGITMPFVGDQMADVLFIENFRQNLYSTLKSNIENDIDPTPDDVTYWLGQALADYLVDADEDDGDDRLIKFATDNTSENIASWFHQWNFTLQDTETVIFENFDLGIPNLGFDSNIPVKAELKWTFSLGFGLNFVEGAYIDVAALEDLDLDLKFTLLPQSDSEAMLGFLKGPLTDPGNDTGAVLNFDIDITNGSDPAKRLGFADIGKLDVATTVVGESLGEAASTDPLADTNAVTLHLATVALHGLPALAADLVIDWALPAGTKVSDLNGNAVTPDLAGAGVDYIALMEMKIDTGSIAESLLMPLLGEILYYIDPFMPVVDVLTAPIPVLSDLSGEPFTLLDLAGIFGSVDPEFIDAVADILDVISMIDEAMDAPVLPLGNIVLFDRANSIESFDPYDAEDRLEDVDLISAPGLTLDAGFDNNQDNKFLEFIRAAEPPVEGLSTPIYGDPLQAIGLFLNQNATMIDYLLPPLGVEFEYLQVFPIWGPLAVSIEISFGFTIDLHSIGFDTYGYQRYADGGFRNPVVMFDGFYFNDLDTDGVDAPEVTFEFGLVGAAELNLGIARAGVGGGINASIYFDWYDPIPDGHVHISELIANVVTAIPGPNPLAVFDIGGALTFQLFAFLEISILGIEEEFPITPETELLSFEETFDHEPVWATDIAGGNLLLNIGPNSRDRIYGDISDGSETVSVTVDAANNVTVEGKSYGVFSNIIGIGGQGNDIITLTLDPASTITYELDGGLGDDTITVTGGTGKGVIIGGVGNDRLTGGDGNDEIYGGEGNDTIQGSGGHDILFGDQGRVVDSGYAPKPYITSRVTPYDGVDEIHGGSGDDVIIGAGGDDRLWGDAGKDILIGDGGRFEFAWIDGRVNIASLRPAAYVAAEVYTDDPDTPAKISADIDAIYDALMATFHATDLFYGGNDEIHGGDNDDMLFGGSGDDILEGDSGNDLILGGKGFDEIFGGTKDSPITLTDTVTDKDTIFGGDQADIISGNEDDDVISGGSGNDYIHGNDGGDVIKGDSGADIIFGDKGDDQIFGLTEPDILFGGAGNDLVVGGTSNDIIFGDDGLVAKLDPDDTAIGLKVIYNDLLIDATTVNSLLAGVKAAEGEFSDDDIRTVDLIFTYVTEDDGDDILSGEAADDLMFGGGGNDLMGGDVDPRLPNANVNGPTDISEDVLIGDGGMITFDQRRFRSIATVVGPAVAGTFDDILYGDNGNDYLFGGWGNDFLFGGHGRVVDLTAPAGEELKGFRGATDAGASDNDIILGDNGEILFADETIPDNFGIKELIRTTDEADDTGGHDYAEGELGNDVIFGGVNGSVDVLIGNFGDDVILGDNGELDFAYGTDTNLDTLDLIRSYRDGLGGTDIISGKEGSDVLIGGTGGDEMYGDDATASSGAADGEDIMLGDNADIFLIGTVGRLTVQVAEMTTGTAVDWIKTSDRIDGADLDHDTVAEVEADGGADTMSGNAGNDIIFGGVNNGDIDMLYGDQEVPSEDSIPNDGDDILLGDNGELRFTLPAGVVHGNEADSDRMTLDLIRAYPDGLGGEDWLSGNRGFDVGIGGNDGDRIYGDDDSASAAASDAGDILLGDNADILLIAGGGERVVLTTAAVDYIVTTDDEESTGGADLIEGNAGADVIVGGVNAGGQDDLYGDAATPVGSLDGDDIILGDNAELDWTFTDTDNRNTLDLIATITYATDGTTVLGGRDNIFGNAGDDVALGGSYEDLIIGDNDESIDTKTPGAADTLEADAGADILIGDQGRLVYKNGLITLIETTDLLETDGGTDYIEGNDYADILMGGVSGDILIGESQYGNAAQQGADYVGDYGNDILLGDEGRMRYDVASAEQLVYAGATGNVDMTYAVGDDDQTTLDVIETFATGNASDDPAGKLGGADWIFGNEGSDIAMGGTDGDDIHGDFYAVLTLDGDWAVTAVTPARAEMPGMDRLIGDGGQVTCHDTANTLIRSIESVYGGFDRIQGNDLADTLIGGQDGDWLWGEAPYDDLDLVRTDNNPAIGASRGDDDVILGDNGRLDYILASDTVAGRPDIVSVTLDGAPATLDRISTTDPTRGGDDLIRGDAADDTIFGGTGKDRIWGDTSDSLGGSAPDGADGRDLVFGDHGKVYPTLPIADPSYLHNNFFAIDTQEADLGNDDVIFGNGNDDTLLGQQGDDVIFGGTEDDILIGGHNVLDGHDDMDDMDQPQQDAILGDVLADKNPSDVNDINDVMDGGSEEDILAGDNAIVIRQINSISPRFQYLTGAEIYTMIEQSLAGLISVNVGFESNVADDPQAKPNSTVGYTVTLINHSANIESNAAENWQDPRWFGNDVMAGGSEDDLLFGELGDDIMQGDGAVQFNDTVTPFDPAPEVDPSFTVPDGVAYFQVDDELRNESLDAGMKLLFKVDERMRDGDDYLEGNGGNDRMYGNLGQDDMIGGSSVLFGLDDSTAAIYEVDPDTDFARPDGADLMYGGAGNPDRLDRNDFVGPDVDEDFDGQDDATGPSTDPMFALENRHARDADVMMGDNANIYRVLTGPAGGYEQFNYDQSYTSSIAANSEDRGDLRIKPRAVELLDYQYSFDASDPFDVKATWTGIGYGDLMYGESGDDILHGMSGDDVLFGISEDDDLYGEIGADWISGGTGVDGILGDDGLMLTSRNSLLGELLYGIAPNTPAQGPLKNNDVLDLNALNTEITTPGDIQRAIINVDGEIKRTVDLIAFDTDGIGPVFNDILYGGLGNDWMHAGDGDDAMLGGEALLFYYTNNGVTVDSNTYTANELLQIQQQEPVNPGMDNAANPFWFDFAPYNPGDILRFEGETLGDADDPHGKTRQEFALYDEYWPRRKLMLNAEGNAVELSADAVYEFLLNFNTLEGPDSYAFSDGTKPTDGDDRMFGDTGNDWMVGGSGRDDMYGGRGDDLLNMDDDHDTPTYQPKPAPKQVPGDLENNQPDEYQAYADIAYGGAGRDILILNTGADRAIDWVGEYNSYIVPFSPFGAFHISRTLQPQLPEFVLNLAISDGIDQTIPHGTLYVEQKNADVRVDDPSLPEFAFRVGEPYGELGMVRQTDYDWQEQTGAPNDPQPGNLQGKREIMRRELFSDTLAATAFAPDVGIFSVSKGVLTAQPSAVGEETVALYFLDMVQPGYMEILATVNMGKPTAGVKSNAYIIFDYKSPTDFKFAGIDNSLDKIRIGHRTESGWVIDSQIPLQLREGVNYNLTLVMYGSVTTIWVDGKYSLSYDFHEALNDDGMIGLGTDGAITKFDNWQVQKLPPNFTLIETADFTATHPFTTLLGDWSVPNGVLAVTTRMGEYALAARNLDVGAYTRLEFDALLKTSASGGVVFDHYSADDFKFVALVQATDTVVIGHHKDGRWFIDTEVTLSLDPAKEYKLTVSLFGTSVSVLVNDQAVAGHVYDSLLNDGRFGLLAKDGTAAFNAFTVRSDDPSFALPAAALMAAAAAPTTSETVDVIDAVPPELVDAAKAYWRNLLGAEATALLDDISVVVSDLGGLTLAQLEGTLIRIDDDAAGYGWFIDATPEDSVEFLRGGGKGFGAGHDSFKATRSSDAFGRMDLLTVLTHEMGHLLGFGHDATWAVMDGDLEAGTRVLPKNTATSSAPGKAVALAVQEALLFDEGYETFRKLVHGEVQNWTEGRVRKQGAMLLADRQRKEELF